VFAIEPSQVCMRLAEPRIAQSSVPVESAGLNGEHLDLPSVQFDAVLSTWTLCTIPDRTAALAELLRVLKPGGSFHFVEHGHAPDPKIARWQERLEPLNKRLAGGCHLTRRISDTIEEAGFEIEQLDTYYFKGEPKIFGSTFEGRASKKVS
jgi:ubiquinone/menaquinone biosynthesis C-methylase UbiE